MTTPEDLAQENARSGFDAAVALWTSEGDIIWSKFAGMMAAHAILIAAIGLAFSTESRDLRILVVALAMLGVFLGVAWLLITSRSFAFQKYWILSARELEQKWLKPVSFIARGEKLADGLQVEFETTPTKTMSAPCLGRWKVQKLMYAAIVAFTFAYPALAVLAYFLIHPKV